MALQNKNTDKNKKHIPIICAIQASIEVAWEFQNLQIDLMKENVSMGIEMRQVLVEFEVSHNQQC